MKSKTNFFFAMVIALFTVSCGGKDEPVNLKKVCTSLKSPQRKIQYIIRRICFCKSMMTMQAVLL